MFKIIGASLLVLSALYLGVSMRREERKQLDLLKATLVLLSHARRKIELFSTPADRLFFDFTDGFDSQTQRVLSEKSAEEALIFLSERLAPYGAALVTFAHEIGCGYIEDVLHHCDDCIEQIKCVLESAEENFTRRKRLYTSLPVLFAISIIVLFI